MGKTIAAMKLLFLAGSGLAALLVFGCGAPTGPERIEFTFTPVAVYTVVATPTRVEEAPLSLDENCVAYIADEVLVVLEAARTEEFNTWLADVGFTIRRSFEGAMGHHVTVVVPLGSVPDAVNLVARQTGVISARKNSNLAEGGGLGQLTGCTPAARGSD
jgi:hypothetical protein